MSASPHRCLVLGGARSGKSVWAEQRLQADPVRYVATGYPAGDDASWAARLQRHRARRPPAWQTIETLAVEQELLSSDPRPVLVDCVTLWLTRTLDQADAWELPPQQASAVIKGPVDALVEAVRASRCEVVLVSNEVGSAIVPAAASGRVFTDLLGELNCRIAAVCHEVVLLVAGIPLQIKGSEPHWRKEQL